MRTSKEGGRGRLLAGALGLLVLAGLGCGSGSRAVPRTLSIATATEGGTYYPVGRHLAAALERVRGSPIEDAWAWITHGSDQNVRLLGNPRQHLEEEPADLHATQGTSPDLAFVMMGTLNRWHEEEPDGLRGVRAVAAMQLDVVQVVVRSEIASLADLAGMRVYMGREGSGTRWVAEQVLATVPGCRPARVDLGFQEAAEALVAGELDAAVFAAGTPTEAVTWAVQNGCRILPIPSESVTAPVFTPASLPRGLYAGLDREIPTVGTWTILCCRADLHDRLVELVLETLHEEVDDLLLSHAKVQHLRLDEAYAQRPLFLPLHSAAERFWRRERQSLRIATGAMSGRYHQIGRALQGLLRGRGIPARAIHTQGSVQNLDLLNDDRPTIALMHYDVALASRWADMKSVYGFEEPDRVPELKGLLALARMHEEKMHVVAHKDAVTCEDGDLGLRRLRRGHRISVSPPKSGSRLVAEALLRGAGILDEIECFPLSMPDTVDRLRQGDLHAAMFVGASPSTALRSVLASPEFRLLSVDGGMLADLSGRAFSASQFDGGAGAYACQDSDEPVATVSVRAVLVATDRLSNETAQEVTAALVDGIGFLPGGLEREDLAKPLASLPFHPGAEAAYLDLGLLPAEPVRETLDAVVGILWRMLATIGLLVAGYQGALKYRRASVANHFGRSVNSVSVSSTEPHSVAHLHAIQTEIRTRVARRWWQRGEIDRARWQRLHDMIEARIREARENLYRDEVRQIRRLASVAATDGRQAAVAESRERLWTLLQEGELNADQVSSLRTLLAEVADADVRPPDGLPSGRDST